MNITSKSMGSQKRQFEEWDLIMENLLTEGFTKEKGTRLIMTDEIELKKVGYKNKKRNFRENLKQKLGNLKKDSKFGPQNLNIL